MNKNPPRHLAEFWVPFEIHILIVGTYSGGPDTAGHPTESTDSPQLSKNKRFPDAGVPADTRGPGVRFLSSGWAAVQAVGVSLQRVDPSQRSAKLFHSITHGRTEARRRLLAQDPPLQWSSKKYTIFFLPIRLERSFSGEPRRCNTGPKCLIQPPSHSPIVCSELFLSNMLFPACSVQYRRKELIIEQKYLPNWAPGSHNLTKVSQ